MSRLDNLRSKMEELNVDAYLVSTPRNVRYLAHFTGSAGQVLVLKDQQFFITDFRYKTQAAEQAQGYEVIIHEKGIFPEVARLLKEHKCTKLAVEADTMTVNEYKQLDDLVDAELVSTLHVIEKIREVKDEGELDLIIKACEIADYAFEYILNFIEVGKTEIEIANELERLCKSQGASAMSFDTIVASGVRSSMPHGVASEKKIEHGDFVTLDFGCYYKGYTSDMTRTIAVGEVNPELEKIYHIVLEAHERVNRQLKAGITGVEADAIARDYIAEQGFGGNFGHTLGHGIGLDVHEGPSLSYRNEEPLVVNNVVTNEPGIYVDGLGGVRIEDDLIVKEDKVISINKSPKNLIVI